MNTKKIEELFDNEFQKLPTNVQFLKIDERFNNDHLLISKSSNNTKNYYPLNFHKIISPVLKIENEFKK